MASKKQIIKGLDRAYYHRIGVIVTYFGELEQLVEQIIWEFFGLKPEQARYLTSHLHSQNRWNLVHMLVKQRLKNKLDLKKFKDTDKILKSLLEERRFIVHGQWCSDAHGTKVVSALLAVPASKPTSVRVKHYTVKKLDEIITQLTEIIDFLSSFLENLQEGLVPLR